MAHLASFRKGWESERLANFILSKFAFIAHPSTVSDDIGSDFFCTLFLTEKKEGKDYLLPKNSFAIQIKSTHENIDVSNKVEYLEQLELPYFVGVVDRSELGLTIYSGEYIPVFFALKGIPVGLDIELCETCPFDNYFTAFEGNRYALKFPKVTEIKAEITTEELQSKVSDFLDRCSLMYKNIATKRNNEHVYDVYGDPAKMLVAGRGSAQHFRDNLLKRLTEVFFNLKWIHDHDPSSFRTEEAEVYEELLSQLDSISFYNRALVEGVNRLCESLKSELQENLEVVVSDDVSASRSGFIET